MRYVLTRGPGSYFSRTERLRGIDEVEIIDTSDINDARKYDLKNAQAMQEWIYEMTGRRWEIEEYTPPPLGPFA